MMKWEDKRHCLCVACLDKKCGGVQDVFFDGHPFSEKGWCVFFREGDFFWGAGKWHRKMMSTESGSWCFGLPWCFEDSFLEDHVKNLPPPDFLNAWLLHAKVRQHEWILIAKNVVSCIYLNLQEHIVEGNICGQKTIKIIYNKHCQ